MKIGILYFTTCFHGFVILRHVDPFVKMLHILFSEPNPLRPLRDLQYGLGETVFGGCRHLKYMNIWGFNEPK